jgi:hypothetical protein
MVEHHALMPGSLITPDQARLGAEHHRDLAKKFADLDP